MGAATHAGSTDFLASYSIQSWLESCPQGYLTGTAFGHPPELAEPDSLLGDEDARERAIRLTVQLVVAERCALAASAGLINATPEEASKRFLATQTLDEARHVEIFTQRLYDLGLGPAALGTTIRDMANPHLIRFADVLLEKIHKGDYVCGVVGQNILLEGVSFTVFEVLRSASAQTNPKLAAMLSGAIADERRHVGFGENTIGALLKRHPEKKGDIEAMQAEMSYCVLAAFAEELRRLDPNPRPFGAASRSPAGGLDVVEVEQILGSRVLTEFRSRLSRLGLEYRTPRR